MRLLLDAHVSARGVGRPLRLKGHGVLALTEDPALESLDDEAVLEVAAEANRILITHDVEDFPPLLRDWAAEGRSHAGVILVHGIDTGEFGVLVAGIVAILNTRSAQESWVDISEVLFRERFPP